MDPTATAPRLPVGGLRLSTGIGAAAWALAAAALAGGAGLLAAANPRLAFTICICAAAALAVHFAPFAVLIVLLVLVAHPSPLADMLLFATVVGGGPVIAWRLVRTPGKVFLVPLALFLLLALNGLQWTDNDPLIERPKDLVLPVLHFHYATLQTLELQEWLRLAAVLVVGLLAAASVSSGKRLRLVAAAVVVGAVFPFVDAVRQIISGDLVTRDGNFGAVRGSFGFPNELAVYLVVILLVAIVAAFVVRRPGLKVVLVGVIGLGAFLLLHTYTRSAWIAFSIGLMLIAVLRFRWLLAVAALTLVVAVAGFPSAVHSVQQRFGDLTAQNQANASNSLTWRRGQWSAMGHFGSDAPLTGQGFGSYRRLSVRQFGLEGRTYGTVGDAQGNGQVEIGFTAHNDFVKAYVENGVPGLVLWVAVLVGLAIAQVRLLRNPSLAPWGVAMLAALVGIVIMSASDNVQAYSVPIFYVVAITAALAALARREPVTAPAAAP
jgi:O-antigen ligase